MITPRQIRAGRALAGWSQGDLARESELASITIQAIEQGKSDPRSSTLGKIQAAFARAGIQFVQGGVQLTGESG